MLRWRVWSLSLVLLSLWVGYCPKSHAELQDRPVHYQWLLKRYSPVIVQEMGRKPLYDLITAFDFDRNFTGVDNVAHADTHALPAIVYGDVVAETLGAYYLFYGFYHIKDYDTRIREFFFPSAAHDNDFEGMMVLVEKESGQVLAMETWFHNTFLQFSFAPDMGRSQTIDGKIHFEDGTHPLVFIQAMGHGVRAVQKIDEAEIMAKPHRIYRIGKMAYPTQSVDGRYAEYQLRSLEGFLRYAEGPFDTEGMMAGPADYGLGEKMLGRFISGEFKGETSWAHPKPPWSWADRFDTLRPGAWFFHPAYTFSRHFEFPLSDGYIFNLANESLFQESQENLDMWAAQAVKSFFGAKPKGPFRGIRLTVRRHLYHVSEYLFYLFG